MDETPCAEWTVRDRANVLGESILSVRLLHGAGADEAMAGLDGDVLRLLACNGHRP